ncbi:hypothetical protein J3D55_004070 [Chryseobacterium ginsenosidimutans]|uniref:hypothetical protein n=1 Tax=Chryseobacterium ginsenosidimutans TaxID=687846 RepID=UPI002167BE9E|nr:hypothetical protein [Chryseobacterium ginsenosidimutans]MCS3871154.1 hypothetical protein [Chryseobacterium ginsenosidimutans]
MYEDLVTLINSTKESYKISWSNYEKNSKNKIKAKKYLSECKEAISNFYFLVDFNNWDEVIFKENSNPFYYEDNESLSKFTEWLDFYLQNIKM